jgi:hypothetical protein
VTDRRLDQLGATAGIVYAVGIFAAAGVMGGVPDFSASNRDMSAYYADHSATRFFTGAYMEVLALLALVFFLGRMWRVLYDAEGDRGWLATTAFGAGIVSLGVKLGSGPVAAAAYDRGRSGLDHQVGRAMIETNDMAFVLTWPINAVFLAAAGAVIVRTRVLPRWLGWSGIAAAVTLVVGAPLSGREGGPLFLVFLLWVVAASITLLRRGGTRPLPAAARQTTTLADQRTLA